MMRATQALIDLSAIKHNLRHAKNLAPKARCVAVVKADAYGHGAIPVARAIADDCDALAVACLEEALELRESDITAPILVLEGVCHQESLQTAVKHQLWLMIHSEAQLSALENSRINAPLNCWVKIDSGMHRLGFPPADITDIITRLQHCVNCKDITLATHFASADEPELAQTDRQIELFEQTTAPFALARSAANSAGVLAFPRAHYEWIRPGYMLYGNSPFAQDIDTARALCPAMYFQCEVIALHRVVRGETVGYSGTWQAQRDSLIATLNAGYADGYPRAAENGAPVLIHGQRAPLAGRVSMDMITVDVSDIANVKPGDSAVLWGKQDRAVLSADEVAQHANTIGYELTTRMPPRTPRRYINP
ncbi:MAG: alanine racemase [Gammaproteobacteria bacterium]|nr:MAG: alanine racemase [Gammaproteobacteria bacterium]